ncbi:hypothetical protein WJX81_005165 [Elliptochloris bilobata]|uniref:Uncharacterized protein n=1 Tax=Elliptochloris bilobata TaxID=381761 RepID=A0AAW1SJA4_9CHLO
MTETMDAWDFGKRKDGEERRKSIQKSMERFSFDGAPSADHSASDGYAPGGDYFKARSGVHAERNSRGDLVALGEAEVREPTIPRRPPSIDLKPSRSEGGPRGAPGQGAPLAAPPSNGPAPLDASVHDGEYVPTGYFARMSAAKAGFPDRSDTNTSSSLLDLASHDEPMAEDAARQ